MNLSCLHNYTDYNGLKNTFNTCGLSKEKNSIVMIIWKYAYNMTSPLEMGVAYSHGETFWVGSWSGESLIASRLLL